MPKKYADKPIYSGFVLTFEPERTQWLADCLHDGSEVKESFSAIDWKFRRRELVLLVLVSDPLSISAMALMERMHGSGGSGKAKMKMTNMVIFNPPVPEKEHNGLHTNKMICTPETLKRSDPDHWSAAISILKEIRPDRTEAIDNLIAMREAKRKIIGDSNKVDRLNEQRDGLGLSLEIARLNRNEVLKSIGVDNIEKAQSVLDLLDDAIPVQERSLLEHDKRVFDLVLNDWPTKNAVFSDDYGKSVRVYISDKTKIETVLGVDLLIYSRAYKSYILIQYKKMKKYNKDWAYPVDKHMLSQLNSMSKFHATLNTLSKKKPTLWSYRINSNPFYFKFCEAMRPDGRDDSLLPGITLCESHLREFLSLPEAEGIKGGIAVGYNNCPRYFNNSEFKQLAKFGWIGAGQRAASLIELVLKANKKGGRAAMLAVIDTPKQKSARERARWY